MDLETVQKQLTEVGFTNFFGVKKEIKFLPEIIDDDEKILYATGGAIEGNTVLAVCTNERILFIDKGMLYGLKSIEIPLDMVNGVSYSKGMLLGKLSIVNGAVTTTIENVDKQTASIMADTIKKAATEFKNLRNNPPEQQEKPEIDLVAQLRDLKGLVDEGILTQEEFEAKKKQVLGI